ncbi:GNAT family N-acetyltransferase [Bacillus sp. CGMCC 1.16541]|uniref:GNAT family N-acetyltransferase n=1 Tax=Bacillus sp. CGMCC 1.16541 TaxID=2185143 RepID=UPI000D73A2E2|nr:GNAT family N-acetyltransferase [Bacillus sp. CGMCC 1.16541]
MHIRLLAKNEQPPMQLLLLADPSEKLVSDYVKRGQCVVIEEEEVVGVYVLLPTRPETVELVNIAVSEHQQNRGIGKKLIQDTILRAKEAGYKTIEVGTGNSSIGQLALYQKCGFRIVSVDKDFFLRHYEEDIYENGIQCMDMIRLSQDV